MGVNCRRDLRTRKVVLGMELGGMDLMLRTADCSPVPNTRKSNLAKSSYFHRFSGKVDENNVALDNAGVSFCLNGDINLVSFSKRTK